MWRCVHVGHWWEWKPSLSFALALVPIGLSAQTTTPGTGTGASGPGGTTINVFCLDFGKKFPDGQSVKA